MFERERIRASISTGSLGASPDGLVGSSVVLEVKRPYGAREITISESLQIKASTLVR